MTFRTPPIVAPNGKPWNFVLLNGDDWMVDTYQNMPLFLANWAQDFTFYPNASCNMPLCFPGRAAALVLVAVMRPMARAPVSTSVSLVLAALM